MRTVDVLICFPDVVIALFLIAIFGTGYGTLIAALTITGWTPFARLDARSGAGDQRQGLRRGRRDPGLPEGLHRLPARHPQRHPAGAGDGVPALRAQADHRRAHCPTSAWASSRPTPTGGRCCSTPSPTWSARPFLGILPGVAIFLTALSVTMIGQGLDIKKTRRKRAAGPGATARRRRPSSASGRRGPVITGATGNRLPAPARHVRLDGDRAAQGRHRQRHPRAWFPAERDGARDPASASAGARSGRRIQRLVQEGLLRSEPHRGVFVPVLDRRRRRRHLLAREARGVERRSAA